MPMIRVSWFLFVLSLAPVLSMALDVPNPVTLTGVRTVAVDYYFSGPMPLWSGGAFITVDHDRGLFPEVSTFGRDGRRLSRLIFQVPDAGTVRVAAIARASDGTLAMAGSAQGNSGGFRYLAVRSPDGRQQTARLESFVPDQLAIASDGTIWAAGCERDDNGNEVPEHLIIRRYSQSGKELGGFLPRSSVKKRPGHPGLTTYSLLLSSHGRIGWYSGGAGEYIEFSNDGQIATRVAVVPHEDYPHVRGAGLCGDGTLYVSVPTDREKRQGHVWTLDRASGSWREVSFKDVAFASAYRQIWGCDEDGLVMYHSTPVEGKGLSWFRPVSAR